MHTDSEHTIKERFMVFSIRFGLLAGLIAIVLALASQSVRADIDVYEFSNEDKRENYLALIRELRCPKCQNQDIADSNAPIAQDMRREVHRMVEEGRTHNEVVTFMIERFGDFVTYKPKMGRSTYLLWFGPVVLIVIGLFVVLAMAQRKRSLPAQSDVETVTEQTADKMSPAQKAQVDKLLSKYQEDDQSNNKENLSD